MNLCFVTGETLNSVWQNKLDLVESGGVLVFGFNGLGLVSYKKELEGQSEYFHDVAKLSKQINGVVISGCDTDTYGVYRHSAVISDKGKILGVTDMSHTIDESEFVAGGGFRVYDTSAGKIGLIIAEDLFFPETARILALCDAEIIICIYKKLEGNMEQVMLRAGAFSNGVAMALCADGYACVSDIRGKIVLASNSETLKANIKIEKDYRLISARRRGLYREFRSGY
ncbi:MAG: carbon-nitrogen hydrolase family protein [Clostridiales bacterium]|nr:carbon-nitrogen hydrolase family protein [Clostridiales bacterium]